MCLVHHEHSFAEKTASASYPSSRLRSRKSWSATSSLPPATASCVRTPTPTSARRTRESTTRPATPAWLPSQVNLSNRKVSRQSSQKTASTDSSQICSLCSVASSRHLFLHGGKGRTNERPLLCNPSPYLVTRPSYATIREKLMALFTLFTALYSTYFTYL